MAIIAMRILNRGGWLAAAIGLAIVGRAHAQSSDVTPVSVDEARVIFGLLEAPANLDAKKVDLGRRLFHDPRLSQNDQVSCASCHVLKAGGDDGRKFSVGISGQPTRRNSPTVFNVTNHIGYFWDGRAETLFDQIDGPVHDPDEMGTDWRTIEGKLSADPGYVEEFQTFYGELNAKTIKDAIVLFQESLITNDTPFDRYLAGNESALTEDAKRGLARFVEYGCASCHQGSLLGGNLYQKFGVFEPNANDADRETFFKVPSLRNVSATAPYFHDGREATLHDAVRLMAKVQLGRELSSDETDELVWFLQALTSDRFMRVNPQTGEQELVQDAL